MEQQQKILTFWDHLEELRHVLFRIAVAVVFLMLVAFLFKDELFAIVLAPKNKRTINAMNNISCIPNPKNNNVPVILSINY